MLRRACKGQRGVQRRGTLKIIMGFLKMMKGEMNLSTEIVRFGGLRLGLNDRVKFQEDEVVLLSCLIRIGGLKRLSLLHHGRNFTGLFKGECGLKEARRQEKERNPNGKGT